MYSSVMPKGHRNWMRQNEYVGNDPIKPSSSRKGSGHWVGRIFEWLEFPWELGSSTRNRETS